MSDLIDFLLDNKVFLIFIIYGLFSFLFRKKKPQTAVKAQPAARQAGGAEAKASSIRSVEDALRQAMEAADREFGAKNKAKAPTVAALPAQESVPQGGRGAATNDPFAFRSLMHSEAETPLDVKSQDYDVTAKDYDLTAQDYDVTAQDYDVTTKSYDSGGGKGDPFTFHSAIEAPAEKEYHLTSFTAFHSAHGLSGGERVEIEAARVGGREGEGGMRITFDDPDQIRRSIIMQEVLGKPLALRRR